MSNKLGGYQRSMMDFERYGLGIEVTSLQKEVSQFLLLLSFQSNYQMILIWMENYGKTLINNDSLLIFKSTDHTGWDAGKETTLEN